MTNRESKAGRVWFWVSQPVGQHTRERVFWITIGFAMTIGIGGIVIAVRSPDLEKLTAVNIPLSVIWFGLLGAAFCGLKGIIQHGDDFDPSYNSWYVAGRLVGAILGCCRTCPSQP